MQLSIFYLYEESRIRMPSRKSQTAFMSIPISSFNEFKKSGYYNGFRMERVMGFYIVVI